MLQQKEKYLYFVYNIYAGLDDQIAMLELMMIAALSLKRTLIVKNTETSANIEKVGSIFPLIGLVILI